MHDHVPSKPLDGDLKRRLQLLLRHLQLQRLAVARRGALRTGVGAADAMEFVAVLDAQSGELAGAEDSLPIEMLRDAALRGRPCSIHKETAPPGSWLSDSPWVAARIWLGPRDRLPCVFFLGLWRHLPDLTPLQQDLAASAFETMALTLAPPTWLPLQPSPLEVGPIAPDAPSLEPARGELLPLREAVRRVERQMLRRALRLADGNRTLAARSLDLTRSGLYRKLKEHGLLSE